MLWVLTFLDRAWFMCLVLVMACEFQHCTNCDECGERLIAFFFLEGGLRDLEDSFEQWFSATHSRGPLVD